MRILQVAGWAFALICFPSLALAQTDILTNGSFESGLTGWTTGQQLEAGAAGTCGYNAATAAGTETITGLPAFSPTDGTQLAMGSVASTNATSAINTCVLYQDVAIPAGATTATFTFDIGVEGVGNDGNHAYKVAIYSTASVPGFSAVTSPTLIGPSVSATVFPANATLQSKTSGSFNISARAGQTVRFAILNAVQDQKGEVIGVDNVKLLVNVAAPPPPVSSVATPALSEWALMALAGLLAFAGFHALRRRLV